MTISTKPTFWKRLALAAINILVPLMTGLILLYFLLRVLGRTNHWITFGIGYVLPWPLVPAFLLFPLSWVHPRRAMRWLAFLPIAVMAFLYGPQFLPSLSPQSAGPTFRVMVHNVFWQNQNAGAVIAQIREQDPDIVGLHEFVDPMRSAVLGELAQEYPYRELIPGAGLISRYPVESCQLFRLDADRKVPGPWAQACEIDIDGQTVTLFNVHPRSPSLVGEDVPWLPFRLPRDLIEDGTGYDIQSIIDEVGETDGPVLVIGDLNITDQHRDYQPLTENLQDAFRQAGWGMGFTYSRWPHHNFSMWRIDYILYSSELTAVSASTADFAGSDHRPVIADLGFKPATMK